MRTTAAAAVVALLLTAACGAALDEAPLDDVADGALPVGASGSGDEPDEPLEEGLDEEGLDEEDEGPAEEPAPDETPEPPLAEPPPAEPEAAAPAACVEYSTRHLQASMQRTDSLAQRRQAIDKAFHNPDGVTPDTISWTEIGTQAQIDRIQNRAGWDTFWPDHPNNPSVTPRNAVPISWKTSIYDFVSGSSFKASDGLAHVSPHRYVTRVRLKHKPSGTFVVRVAHHSVSKVDNPTNHAAYRIAAHAKNMKKFDEVMEGAAFPVIGSGDFNTVHLRSKLKSVNGGVQKYQFDVPDHGGSHGARLLDWIVRRKSDGNRYQLEAVRFVDLAPSDHRGVRARYTYRPAPCP